MINLAVINIKDIIKILKIIFIIAITLIVIFKFGSDLMENKNEISFEKITNIQIISLKDETKKVSILIKQF